MVLILIPGEKNQVIGLRVLHLLIGLHYERICCMMNGNDCHAEVKLYPDE